MREAYTHLILKKCLDFGAIIKNNSEIKQTHNLEELLKICVTLQEDFNILIDPCMKI